MPKDERNWLRILTVALGLLLLSTPAFAKRIHPGLVSLGCFVEAFTDCDLAKAVMHTESGGLLKHSKVLDSNGKYSRGVMQIQDATAKDMGFKGDYSKLSNDPAEGFRYGLKYLRWQMKRYRNYELAVAAYNAGSAIRRNGTLINEAYVNKVKQRYTWLKNKNQEIRPRYLYASSYWDGFESSMIAYKRDSPTLWDSIKEYSLVLRLNLSMRFLRIEWSLPQDNTASL